MKPLTPSQQRYFGVSVAAACMMLAWITWRAFGSLLLSGCLVFAGVVFASVYYWVPATREQLIAVFRTITFPIQWLMTLIVLAIVYYGVLTPIAIWYRVSGKSMRRTDSGATSNWQSVETSSEPDSYFRTF